MFGVRVPRQHDSIPSQWQDGGSTEGQKVNHDGTFDFARGKEERNVLNISNLLSDKTHFKHTEKYLSIPIQVFQ